MKTVLITGANQGIGFETARQMAELGYFVYLGSRDAQKGQDAVNKLKAMGISNIESLQLDITDSHSIHTAKELLASKIAALDVLINNAGIIGKQPQHFSDCDIETLRKVFDTNFFGTVQTTQAFIPLLKQSDGPTVVNLVSELGSLSMWKNHGDNPGYYNFCAYGSSKTALNAFTVMLANEFRDSNFSINSVSPGYTATELNNYQGTKPVEEGAKLIVKRATANDHQTGLFFSEEGGPEW